MAFRGTQKECLTALAREVSVVDAAELLVLATGRTESTVCNWLLGGRTPGGATDLALRSVLATLGYSVNEYAELSQPSRDLADMLAFGVITPDEAITALGYTDEHAIYRLTLQGGSPMGDKIQALRRLIREHAEALEMKRDWWRQRADGVTRLNGASEAPASPAPSESMGDTVVSDTQLPPEFEAALAGFQLIASVGSLVRQVRKDLAHHDADVYWDSLRENLTRLDLGESDEAVAMRAVVDALWQDLAD